jgi:3-dehydroquinate dehydratase-2
MLGNRKEEYYGDKTLDEIDALLRQHAELLGVEVSNFQSNSEGALINYIQAESVKADGIIINPGALTHYGLSLRDALEDTNLPIIEVHLSNIYAREEWRQESVIAPIARGQISGLGWRSYTIALQALVGELQGEA